MTVDQSVTHEKYFSRGRRAFHKTLPVVACLMSAALLHYSASAVAGTATFSIQDKTNLQGSYAIYVAGYSATPGYYLKNDGTWASLSTLPSKTTQIPCYRLGSQAGQINKVVIDSTQSSPPPLSARLYYFVATDTKKFSSCTNTNGIFNTKATLQFTKLSGSSYNVVQPSLADVSAGNLPMYNFSEIGPGPKFGTIDLSQVDFFSFPMTIQASVAAVGKGALQNPGIIGNTYDANPAKSISFSDNAIYATYMNKLAGTGGCGVNSKSPACAYLDLSSTYGKYAYLANPGNYLQQVDSANVPVNAKSRLNSAFDGVIKKLWKIGAPAITLNNGGPQGGAPQDTFTGTVVSMAYPCGAGNCPTTTAIRFVGGTSGYVFYIFNPLGYDAGCAAGTIKACPVVHSSGYQVFAGAGVFASTADAEYAQLSKSLPTATTKYGVGAYVAQVARMGLIMTQAMNHGVALMQCAKGTDTWKCWNLEASWYPAKISDTYPDITQNLFAQFMHTALNSKGIPMFIRPPDAVMSAGGQPMGMAYGFSNDEQPTPPVANSTSPEVPSKMDQTVQYNGSGPYTITFGPWN